jgi:signal transduction histidine kinase
MKPRFNPPILAGIVALVAVSLLAALGAMLLVTFRGPPPHARPLSLDEVAAAVRTAQSDVGDWRLDQGRANGAPAAPSGMHPSPRLAEALALRIGLKVEDVRFYQGRGPDPRFGSGGTGPWDMKGPKPRFLPPFMGPEGPRSPLLHGAFLAAWKAPNGQWRSLAGERRGSLRWYAVTLSLMLLIFALLLVPAYFVARRITGPIRRLAEGVAGNAETSEPLPVEGPPEVRHLGQAFNRMRALLVGHVTERTAMLVAIAHDLRTPMTRLSFRLEQLPEAERAKAQADVEEMRGMVTALLDFVRGDSDPVTLVRMELSALVETLADDMADMRLNVTVGHTTRAVIRGDAAALRRCIGNIVENAVRYGGSARLALATADGLAELTVDDDGPGIEADRMDRICEPFYRGEQSRNRETGGVGLGLSITRTIAEKHGGTISFANRPEGGLRVALRLPLAG